MSDHPQCETCGYWMRNRNDHSQGACRREAPSRNSSLFGVWPRTHSGDWCGQHSDLEKLRIRIADSETVIESVEAHAISVLDQTIEELPLSPRCYSCLYNNSIHSVGELMGKTERELLRMKNLGQRSLDEIKQALADRGLFLKRGT